MSTNRNRLVLTCVIFVFFVCLCTVGAVVGGIIVFHDKVVEAIPVLGTVLPNSASHTPSPPVITEESPAEISKQMDKIQEQVVSLRGLQPSGVFTRELITTEQLNQKVRDDFLKDYTPEEAKKDVVILSALGLIEPGFDMLTFYTALLTEQVAGFYDNEIKAMYVVQNEGFGGVQRMTYAHEYTHALQDQTYDLKNGLRYDDEICSEDTERCAGVLALVEGDAQLLSTLWLTQYASSQDYTDLLSFSSTYQSPVLDNAPPYIQEDLMFPYEKGQTFVQSLYSQGGWSAVDSAYRNEPVSTEQILHPEKYPDEKPILVSLPDLSAVLGDGWTELERNVMGEWYTYLILTCGIDSRSRLSPAEANRAASGWGGDAYVAYSNDQTQSTILVFTIRWDTPADADEFTTAFQTYAAARFGEPSQTGVGYASWVYAGGYSEFHYAGAQNAGAQTTWILSPDEETAQAVWAAIK
jgi:hypothetical protein